MLRFFAVLPVAVLLGCTSTASAGGDSFADSGVDSSNLPGPHDFGKIPVVGGRAEWKFMLAPAADQAHLVVAIEGGDAPAFHITQQQHMYQTVDIDITFLPTEERHYAAQLVVYGEGHTGRVLLDLTGQGTLHSGVLEGRIPTFLSDKSLVFQAVGTHVGDVVAPDDYFVRFAPPSPQLTGLLGVQFDKTTYKAKGPFLTIPTTTGLIAALDPPAATSADARLVYAWTAASGAVTPVFAAAELVPQITLYGLVADGGGQQVVAACGYRCFTPNAGKPGTDVVQCYWKDLQKGTLTSVADTGNVAVGCTPLAMAADGSEAIVFVDTSVGNKLNPPELRRVTAAGGQGTLLALTSGAVAVNPKDVKAFSPDLSLAVVVTDQPLLATDTDQLADVYLVASDGSPARCLTTDVHAQLLAEAKISETLNAGYSEVSFSADGKHVGFIAWVNTGFGDPTHKFLEAMTMADVASGALRRIGAVRSGFQQPSEFRLAPDGSWAAWSLQQAMGIGFSATWNVYVAAESDWPMDVPVPL